MFRLFLLLGILTVSSQALSQEAMAPSSFRIVDIRNSGTACPPGSIAINVSDDQEAFTVTFSQFVAEIGPGVATEQNRKNCRLVFDSEQDAGWEFAVMAINVRGFAQLDAGVKGRQALKYGIAGKDADGAFVLNGPFADQYQDSSTIPLGQLKWTGCRPNVKERVRDFVITTNAQLTANSHDARGFWAVDSVDGQLEQSYDIVWRQCGNNKGRVLTICRVPANDGSGRSLIVKGTGRNENQSMNKAQKKIAKKCQRPGGARRGTFACNVSATVCSSTPF